MTDTPGGRSWNHTSLTIPREIAGTDITSLRSSALATSFNATLSPRMGFSRNAGEAADEAVRFDSMVSRLSLLDLAQGRHESLAAFRELAKRSGADSIHSLKRRFGISAKSLGRAIAGEFKGGVEEATRAVQNDPAAGLRALDKYLDRFVPDSAVKRMGSLVSVRRRQAEAQAASDKAMDPKLLTKPVNMTMSKFGHEMKKGTAAGCTKALSGRRGREARGRGATAGAAGRLRVEMNAKTNKPGRLLTLAEANARGLRAVRPTTTPAPAPKPAAKPATSDIVGAVREAVAAALAAERKAGAGAATAKARRAVAGPVLDRWSAVRPAYASQLRRGVDALLAHTCLDGVADLEGHISRYCVRLIDALDEHAVARCSAAFTG